MIIRQNSRKAERGQVLILCALFMIVLMLFVGLAIDFGMAYVTKAQLGKAADAAVLTASRYSALGTTKATALAQSAFAMNYNPSSLAYDPTVAPVITLTYSSDANGNTVINTTVNATIKTSFAGILPAFNTVNVATSAQALARRVAMTLVLDRTGSMNSDGGSTYLAGAVTDFIGYFNDSTLGTGDFVSVISFANDVKVDVPWVQGGGNFEQAVINDANSLSYKGATYSDGALQLALTTENAYPGPANIKKVVVFFTDGNANTIQNNLTCTGKGNVPSGVWNIGGDDTVNSGVGFLTTSNPAVSAPNYPLNSNPANYYQFENNNSTSSCNGLFTNIGGKQLPITWANVSGPAGDARARALVDANNMRAAGIYVYAVGLGTATDPVDPTFLCEIANDPCSPTYDSTQPVGAMEFAASAAQLDQAFQTAATLIRLQLTQ